MAGIRPARGLVSRIINNIGQGANGQAAAPKMTVAAVKHFSTDDKGPKTNQPQDLRQATSVELQNRLKQIREALDQAESHPQANDQKPSTYAGVLGPKKITLFSDKLKQEFAAGVKTPEQIKADAMQPAPAFNVEPVPEEQAKAEQSASADVSEPKAPKMPPPPPPPPPSFFADVPPPPPALAPPKTPAFNPKMAKFQVEEKPGSLMLQELKELAEKKAKENAENPDLLKKHAAKWDDIYAKEQNKLLDEYKKELEDLKRGKQAENVDPNGEQVEEIQLSAAERFANDTLGEVALDVRLLVKDAFSGAKTLQEMEVKAVHAGPYAGRMLDVIKIYTNMIQDTVKAEGSKATNAEVDLGQRIFERLGVARNRFSFLDTSPKHGKILMFDAPDTVERKLLAAVHKDMKKEDYEKLLTDQSKQTIVKSLFQSPLMKTYEEINGSAALNYLKNALNQEIAAAPTLKQALVHFYEKHGADNFKSTSYKGLQEQNAELKDEVEQLKARLRALEGK